MLAFVKSQPNILQRMVRHISAAPITDVLFRIMQQEIEPKGVGIIDWLASEGLAQMLVDRLAPNQSLYTHLSATEFIKALINFCSTANANAGNSEFAPPSAGQNQHPQTLWGKANAQAATAPDQISKPPMWASTALLRELVSPDIIGKMLRFALDDLPVRSGASTLNETTPRVEKTEDKAFGFTPVEPAASTSKAILLPTTFASLEPVDQPPTAEQATSSLVHCLSIITDLIRKINSDFAEQQILHYLHKQEAMASAPDQTPPPSLGPTVVDLTHLAMLVSERIEDLNYLLSHPRSNVSFNAVSKSCPTV
jgi:hypothetical protein